MNPKRIILLGVSATLFLMVGCGQEPIPATVPTSSPAPTVAPTPTTAATFSLTPTAMSAATAAPTLIATPPPTTLDLESIKLQSELAVRMSFEDAIVTCQHKEQPTVEILLASWCEARGEGFIMSSLAVTNQQVVTYVDARIAIDLGGDSARYQRCVGIMGDKMDTCIEKTVPKLEAVQLMVELYLAFKPTLP